MVDDDEHTRALVAQSLRDEGFHVLSAASGAIARKVLRCSSFDVVVLDRRMPGMDCRTLIAQLRTDPNLQSLPILLAIGEGGVEQRVRELGNGADDYIRKPIDPGELAARIRLLIRHHRSEERVRQVIESASDGFLAWDRTGVIVEWNAQAEAIFGRAKHEAIGRDVAGTILAPGADDAYARAVTLALESPDRQTLEWVELIGVRGDGREIPIEVTTWAMRVGDSYNLGALVRSIDARRELEYSLRMSERLQSLMDATSDVCTLTDTDGTILYVSPSCRRTLGYDPESLVGTLSQEFVHPEDRDQFGELSAGGLGSETPMTKLLRVRAQSGEYVWMETTGCAVRNATTGDVAGFQTVARDVTCRRAVEAKRERRTEQLWIANVGLTEDLIREEQMVRELGDLNRLKDDFVATVSHELRTPLTSIVGYTEILDDGDLGALDEDQHRVLAVLDQNARRLLGLVEDLLTIGRIDSGSFRCDRSPLPLRPLIEASGNAVMPAAHSKGIRLVMNVDPGLGTIAADPAQLDRLLLNLLGNALKFTPRHGRVELSARATADEIVISVTDTGVGIPVAEQGQVFSRFYRTRQSITDAIPGTGLGLAIAKSIVERHDGRISLDSEPGRGTTVTVVLPQAAVPTFVTPPDSRAPRLDELAISTPVASRGAA